jgi:hypothetical protein
MKFYRTEPFRFALLFPLAVLFVSFTAFAQSGKATLSGYIKSAADGEALIGAGVYVEELKKGATSNVYGFYSLTLPKGKYTVRFLFLGYETQIKTLDLENSQTIEANQRSGHYG